MEPKNEVIKLPSRKPDRVSKVGKVSAELYFASVADCQEYYAKHLEAIERVKRHLRLGEVITKDLLSAVAGLLRESASLIEKQHQDIETMFLSFPDLHRQAITHNARTNAKKRTEVNAEAATKERAIEASKKLWEEREAGKLPGLRTEDQFAMRVAKLWPVIASISAIKKRSTSWRNEAKAARKNERAS